MIVKQELVKRIKDYFNLNIYETKVWLALLSKGVASAGEIAELSEVPRSRTYDVLESLEKRGFAMVRIGKPVKYISVKPTEVLEKMKNKTMHEAQEKVLVLTNLKETPEYAELEQLHNVGILPIKPHDLMGSLRGRSSVLSKIREMFENAQKEVILCTSDSDFDDKSRILIPVLNSLLKKDVKIKLIISGDIESIKRFSAKTGLKVRSADTKARFFMADKKEVICLVTPEKSEEEIGIWLDAPHFSSALQILTEQLSSNTKMPKAF